MCLTSWSGPWLSGIATCYCGLLKTGEEEFRGYGFSEPRVLSGEIKQLYLGLFCAEQCKMKDVMGLAALEGKNRPNKKKGINFSYGFADVKCL